MTRARPNAAAPPPSECGYVAAPDLEEPYAAILAKPYEDLDASDCRFVVSEAAIFLPVDHIRYFAPALMEHGCGNAGRDYLTMLIPALLKACPLPDPGRAAMGLQTIVDSLPARRFTLPLPGIDWRDGLTPDLLSGRLLRLALELDENARAMLGRHRSADEPSALAVVEMAFGTFEAGWPPPPGADLLDPMIAAVEAVARGPRGYASQGARFVLGEVPSWDLPRCGDPHCRAHPDPSV